MFGENEYYPRRVLTNKGVLDVKDIIPGDYVYEYKTGEMIKVLGISNPVRGFFTDIQYSNGIIKTILNSDKIFNGKNIVNINSFEKNINNKISFYPVTFHNNITSILNPDPYVAGALFIYGDFNDKYLNLPSDMLNIIDVLVYKYHIEVLNIIDSKVHFIFKDNTNSPITWEDFFGNNIRELINESDYKFIPNKYFYSLIKDRIQLIRGIFDTGYNPSVFHNGEIGINVYDYRKLYTVQYLLLSLGIISHIEIFDHDMNKKSSQLTIHGKYYGYSGFIYNIENMIKLINHKLITADKSFYIEKIYPSDILGLKYIHVYMSNLILEKPNTVYLDNNFLPVVSI